MRALVASVALLGLGLAADGPVAHADPPAATPSADTPMLDHADAVASYTMRATLDPVAHTVHGEGTIVWKNASTVPVSELWIHLYLNAFKNQSSVFMRAPVGGFRGTTVPETWGSIDLKKLAWNEDDLLRGIELHRPNDEDETDAHVTLPRPIPPGETVTFTMEWDDKLPSIVERTGYQGSFHLVGQWFPKIARLEHDGSFAHFPFHHLGEFYSDYGRYDVTLDVPKAFVVGATGPEVESHDAGDRHVERHVQSDIHEFAWTAWDRFQTRKEKIRDVDVTILFPPGYDSLAERELATMRFALPHFDARYGRYPYSVLTLVHPPEAAPEAGGMEYPTFITTGNPSWMPPGVWFPEAVTIHEYGHQYFYGLSASNEDSWPFLDEGLNSYAENESLRTWLGPGSGADFLGLRIGDVEYQATLARAHGHDEKIAQGAGAFESGADYGALVYARTSTVLETLARVYGKEKMTHALGVYARKTRFLHPTPEDLLATIRAEIGDGAADNLRLALFDKGWVDLTVTQLGSSDAGPPAGLFDRGGKREKVDAKSGAENGYDGWALVTRRGNLKLPTEIELVAEDGARTRVSWDGQSETFRAPFKGTSPLRAAIVDPDGKILIDDEPANNFGARKPSGAPRVFERATFWAAAILGGIGP